MYDISAAAAYSLASTVSALPAIQSTANPTNFTGEKSNIIVPDIDPSSVNWGGITGDIKDQKDLYQALEDIKQQIEDAISEQINTSFNYKGDVNSVADLPETAEKGDCYNVLDTGADYLFNGEKWDKLSETYDFTNFASKEEVENLKSLYYTKTEIDNLLTDIEYIIDRKIIEKVDLSDFENYKNQIDDTVASQEGSIQALTLQINQLQQMVRDLKSLDYEVITLYDGSDVDYENEEKDFVLSGAITNPTVVEGRNITLSDAIVTAANFESIAVQDITVKNTEFNGVLPKAVSNYLLSVKCNGYVNIIDSVLNPTSAYNGIEIGLSGSVPKSVIINNVDFSGHLSNNGINIFGIANNGVVTVSNCHFASLSNVFRISNRLNTVWTLNIINCTCDEWETGDYAGMILLQDYTSHSAEEANEVNQFAKLTINIMNVTKPDGNKIQPIELSSICGSRDENQIIYMWDSYRMHTNYGDKYPTINIM